MIDLLEQAGDELVSSIRGSGPTTAQLRRRLHRRRRRLLTVGSMAIGAFTVVVVLAVTGRDRSSQVTTVPTDPPPVGSTVIGTIPTAVPTASPLGDLDRIVSTGGPVGLDPATGYQVSSVQVGISGSGAIDANITAQAVYVDTASAPAGRWLTAQQVSDTIDQVATDFPWARPTDALAPASGYRGRVGERSTALVPLADSVLILDGEVTADEFDRVLQALGSNLSVDLPYIPAGYIKSYEMSVVPPEAEIVWTVYYTAPGLDPTLNESVAIISRFRSAQPVDDFGGAGILTTIGGYPAVALPSPAIRIDVSPTVQIEVQGLLGDADDLPALLPSLRALTESEWDDTRAEAAAVMERRRLGESQTPSSTVSPVATGRASDEPSYVVEAGDSLMSIAIEHSVSISDLIRANGLGSDGEISVGDRLVIPRPDTSDRTAPVGCSLRYQVRPGDSLDSIAAAFEVTAADLAELNPELEMTPGNEIIIPTPAHLAAGYVDCTRPPAGS